MLSIHNNLKFQQSHKMHLCNNYPCLQALIVNNTLTWQSSCVIANKAPKTAKATYLSKAIISKFLAQPGLTAGWQADGIQANFEIFKIGCRSKYLTCRFV